MRNLFVGLIVLFSGNLAAETPVFQEDKEWPAELNTAKDCRFLEPLERQVIEELNKVRSNPKRFAEEYLEELQTAFQGKVFFYPGQEPLKSQEGIAPLIECINELKQTQAVSILHPAEGLTKAAEELVADQFKNGGTGHIARNGSTPQKRIEKYGEWDICSAEDITYGPLDARQIVIFVLMEHGVS